ncbi:MAG TPA: GxxExxY protein [Verrucomicrobiae bacterium]|nr:GxxExxY protein [Verrucomicrobiae bacterium]
MSIEVATEIRVLGQEEFHALDRKLMAVVFDVHNEFGRFLDEALYKREIAARWLDARLGTAEREVRITVTYASFRKDYSMDLLFNHGLMLEAKVAEAIVAAHRTQGLNYLFLTGMQHARLVNLRPERVEHEFLSTRLTAERRRQFAVVDAGWRAVNDESTWLREKVVSLLSEWGTFLEVALYRDAVTHFLGGSERVVQSVPVRSRGRWLGEQLVHLLTDDTAFAFTAITSDRSSMEDHQIRFLKHTPLCFVQWVNFNRHQIEFTTLAR